MPSMPQRTSLTGVSSTTGNFVHYFPDIAVRPFQVGIGCTVSSTAMTYSIQHSYDYTGSSTFTSTAATWFISTAFSSVAGVTQSGFYDFPVTAMRLNVTTGTTAASTATVTVTFVQAG
jgi:hypothetical protein